MKDISIWDYFQSWLLRGDNPSCYIVTERGNTGEIYYEIADDYCETFDPWRKASINGLPEVIKARKIRRQLSFFITIIIVNQSRRLVVKVKSCVYLRLIVKSL